MKVVKSLTAKETLELISKQYATISDIQSIAVEYVQLDHVE